jgi:hypothetical protein
MDNTVIEQMGREKAEVKEKHKQAEQEWESRKQADFRAGKAAGREWAKDAPYTELTQYRKGSPEEESFRNSAVSSDIMKKKEKSLQWATGWVEGVREFCQEIERKL